MAVTKGIKRRLEEDDNYLSDESVFYGDEATKQELETQVSELDTKDWWEHRQPSLMEIAEVNLKTAVTTKPSVLYNPYEGVPRARQLGETVDEFVERLPPATTSSSEGEPWIFIANPFLLRPVTVKIKPEFSQSISAEAPLGSDSDWAQFVKRGGDLLNELTSIRHEIEKKNVGKAKQTITKALHPQKEEIVKKLLDTAVDCRCTSGKWMLFCEPDDVNAVWAVIARGTANNELGIASKVAADTGEERKQRLMCVYTKDFSNLKDVTRVANKLREYGLIDARGKAIYYKCDAYTYLNINSANEFNIKASLYNSVDILNPKSQAARDGKVTGFFYKKKKDEKDWGPMENK